ncbi:MAG: hypothetical protein ACRCR1_04870 [Aeromonas sp.]
MAKTIYSTYEVELQTLCRRYQENKLGGKLFENYPNLGLVKVNNFVNHHFPQLKNKPEQQLINVLRKLRNQCIHHDGKTYKNNGNPIIEIHELIENHPELFHHDGLVDIDENGNVKKYANGSERRRGQYVIFETGCLHFIIDAFQSYVEAIAAEYRKHI